MNKRRTMRIDWLVSSSQVAYCVALANCHEVRVFLALFHYVAKTCRRIGITDNTQDTLTLPNRNLPASFNYDLNRKQLVEIRRTAGRIKTAIGFAKHQTLVTNYRNFEKVGNWRNDDGKVRRSAILRYRCKVCRQWCSRRFSLTIANFVETDQTKTPRDFGFTCNREHTDKHGDYKRDASGKVIRCRDSEFELATYRFTGRETTKPERIEIRALGKKIKTLPEVTGRKAYRF